tara:strand:- start:1972 stop:2202 length:231 start_codon:yes stop_codon:yes gene_type:complete
MMITKKEQRVTESLHIQLHKMLLACQQFKILKNMLRTPRNLTAIQEKLSSSFPAISTPLVIRKKTEKLSQFNLTFL